jgi:hypothetical protein
MTVDEARNQKTVVTVNCLVRICIVITNNASINHNVARRQDGMPVEDSDVLNEYLLRRKLWHCRTTEEGILSRKETCMETTSQGTLKQAELSEKYAAEGHHCACEPEG